MDVYNEDMELIENPDLDAGYITETTRIVHHDAVLGVEEQWHYEVLAEYPNGGKDVRKVIDVDGVIGHEAYDEEVTIQVYVPYTEEYLADLERQRNQPSQLDRIEAQVLYTALLTDTLIEEV